MRRAASGVARGHGFGQQHQRGIWRPHVLVVLLFSLWMATSAAAGYCASTDDLRCIASLPSYLVPGIAEGFAAEVIFEAKYDCGSRPDALVVTHTYGFEPNLGDEHICPATPDWRGPWGHPEATAGKVSTSRPCPRRGCAGGHSFENDSPREVRRYAKHCLRDKTILRRLHEFWDSSSRSPAERWLRFVADGARAPYEGEPRFLPEYCASPYSSGMVHWPITVTGAITSLICFPYSGTPEEKAGVTRAIQHSINWEDGIGTEEPAKAVVANFTLTDQQRQAWQVEDPIPMGDLWGLTVESWDRPFADPLVGITTPVTITLTADRTPPDDAPGRIGGKAILTRLDPWTTAHPPKGSQAPLELDFPSTGEDQGTCTVELQKGFRYRLTVADGAAYRDSSEEFCVPNCGETRNTSLRLAVLRALVVRTERDGRPVPGHVHLTNASGTVDLEVDTEPDGEGHYSHIFTDLAVDDRWRVRVRPLNGSEERYSDVYGGPLRPPSAVPRVMTLRVPPVLPRLW